jgi:hypothetical protein
MCPIQPAEDAFPELAAAAAGRGRGRPQELIRALIKQGFEEFLPLDSHTNLWILY